MAKKIYKIKGMDCVACAKLIELDLEDAGIKARCDYGKQELEVDFDEIKSSEEKIRQVVELGGYKLTSPN